MEDKLLQQYCSVEELFPPSTTVFMLGSPHYGAQGSVLRIAPEHQGRIQLKFEAAPEPDLAPVVASQAGSQERWEVGLLLHLLPLLLLLLLLLLLPLLGGLQGGQAAGDLLARAVARDGHNLHGARR